MSNYGQLGGQRFSASLASPQPWGDHMFEGLNGIGVDPSHDPNSPEYQANQLGQKEQGILGRAAPQMGEVSNAGLAGARNNQLAGLSAQQGLMAGPSLAGMRANQQFGGAQQAMVGAGAHGGALGMRGAMMGGGAQLGAIAQAGGNAAGQEQLQGQQGIATGLNTLGQGDVASQTALEQAMEKQRGLNLNQRGQNLGTAQGYEQNYFNTQNAYTQQAKAQYALYLQKQQGLDAATANDIAMGGKVVGAELGMM